MLPVTEICGKKISRLIIGGNTISGTSHVSSQMDTEMEDYFTTANIIKMLSRGMECGINAELLDYAVLMTVEPGYAGQKIMSSGISRTKSWPPCASGEACRS